MSKLAKSILYFGTYILLTGSALLVYPQFLLGLLQIEEETNIWMQLLGLALAALGVYYIKAARDNNLAFFKGTVPIRIGQFVVVAYLVYVYNGPYILLAVSAIEAISGLVTVVFLKSDSGN